MQHPNRHNRPPRRSMPQRPQRVVRPVHRKLPPQRGGRR